MGYSNKTYSNKAYSIKNSSGKYSIPRNHKLRLGLSACPHCEADKSAAISRNSIAEPIAEMESTGFGVDLDALFILGDFAANQGSTELSGADLTNGADCSTQLNSGTTLTRNKIYTITGNHDAGVGNYNWYDRYIDLFGQNTAYSGVNNSLRPYTINGTRDRYSLTIGNTLWLFMGDKNDECDPCGFTGTPTGGFPSGSVASSTYDWWVAQIEANPTKNIFTCAHNNLKDTTFATGDNEGVNGGYHGTTGQPIASGRLENEILTSTTYQAERFSTYLNAHPGCLVAWFCGHSHGKRNESYAGRTSHETKYGVHFINVGHLTRYHGATSTEPHSTISEFISGSTTATFQNFNHGGFRSCGLDPNYIISLTLPYAFQL